MSSALDVQLQVEEKTYHSIFDALGDGVLITDIETGRVVEANPAASALYGYTHQELMGLSLLALTHSKSVSALTGYLQAASSGDGPAMQMVHQRQDGSTFHSEVYGTTFIYQGRPGLLNVVRDVGARVHAEQRRQHELEAHAREQSLQATLHERQRLAQELHDAVNQSLFSAGLIAEVLPRLWERDQEEARRSLEDLRRLTRGALAEMRLLLAELRPSALTDTDLGDLLHLLGNALAGRTNIPVRVTVSGQGAMPAEVQVALYRLCQEALNNIAKHARAHQVALQLQQAAGAVTLLIQDDGRGFDPEQIPSGHYGLSIMRERAEAIGAKLSVTSQPGQGSEIAIHWFSPAEPDTL